MKDIWLTVQFLVLYKNYFRNLIISGSHMCQDVIMTRNITRNVKTVSPTVKLYIIICTLQ